MMRALPRMSLSFFNHVSNSTVWTTSTMCRLQLTPRPAFDRSYSEVIVVNLVGIKVARGFFVVRLCVLRLGLGLRRLGPEDRVERALGALGAVLDEVGVGSRRPPL